MSLLTEDLFRKYKPRLLLVEDDELLRETMAHILQQLGLDTALAPHAEDALERIQWKAFDIVITDLVMPGKSGLEVLQGALAANPDCTVLLLTGFGSVRLADEAIQRGAYDFVTKPLQINELRLILRRLVERYALLKELHEAKTRISALELRLEELEATKGRLEMLAQRMAPTPNPSASVKDLEQLGEMHRKGLLSEQEFIQAKRAMLSRWLG